MTDNPNPRRFDMKTDYISFVLEALDSAGDEIFNSGQPHFIQGWLDNDLHDLLPALEAQFDRLWSRHNPLETQDNEA